MLHSCMVFGAKEIHWENPKKTPTGITLASLIKISTQSFYIMSERINFILLKLILQF